MSSGAKFVRADLHVHTRPDDNSGAAWNAAEYVKAAIDAGISVLAVTDHNVVDRAEDVIEAAANETLLVLPGVEITTHQGHLLAIFAPDNLTQLREFVGPSSLRLAKDPRDSSLRSSRSVLDLVEDIDRRGGLAVVAHVDAPPGIQNEIGSTALQQLLSSPSLAGFEFRTHEALTTWFTEDDPDHARRAAYMTRMADPELKRRGLARLMSSDAHIASAIGGDSEHRTLTRLRLDALTFDAVRNAIVYSPGARCKAERDLPINYPRVVRAEFEGGFLDGMDVQFSPNLTCFVGGRGSGKSTALLAMRAALGGDLSGDDDPDAADRMPDVCRVTFVDRTGSQRTVERTRGGAPVESLTGAPIHFQMADMGQGASGRVAGSYAKRPGVLRQFLDIFVDLDQHCELEAELIASIDENAAVLSANGQNLDELKDLEKHVSELTASLKAAENGQIDLLAQWAAHLASEETLLQQLDSLAAQYIQVSDGSLELDVDQLASEFGVDLNKKPASEHVQGEDGVREAIADVLRARDTILARAKDELVKAIVPLEKGLEAWRQAHESYCERRDAKQRELEDMGLRVQAGEVLKLSARLEQMRTKVRHLKLQKAAHEEAVKRHFELLGKLEANRVAEHERRKATLKRVVKRVNEHSLGPIVHVSTVREGDVETWCSWLRENLGLRSPRVERVAAQIAPLDLAKALEAGEDELGVLSADGEVLIPANRLTDIYQQLSQLSTQFELRMMRLDDRIVIEIQTDGNGSRRSFDHISAGQQRSVLLSLLLSADRDEPLIIDQPEDHLDASFISTSIVRQLERAKERRQIIIATHSANLTVLGDAELVVPMYATEGIGRPEACGAVDHPVTREHVCELLEGGRDAYRSRGNRYGMRVVDMS